MIQNKKEWIAQEGSQRLFLACPFFEVLYGGTRGPGKTDALLMSFFKHVGVGFGSHWRGVIFRRSYKELGDVIAKSKRHWSGVEGAKFLRSNSDLKWVFKDGEELLFRHIRTYDDYNLYHGHEYPFIGFEELTTWPTSECYEAMKSVCRSSHQGVPRMYRATTNPYGIGHNWVKHYFVDPAPPLTPIVSIQQLPMPSGETIDMETKRVYIHGTISENKILMAADPNYYANLMSITDPNKRKAWVEGSWDISSGGALDDLWNRDVHVVAPFEIPRSWKIDRSFDWGSSKPYACCWFAECDGTPAIRKDGVEMYFPRGTLFLIVEDYGWNGKENEGCRRLATEVARKIKNIEETSVFLAGRYISAGAADCAMWSVDNGQSIATDFMVNGINWIPSSKGAGSRHKRLELLRTYLHNAVEKNEEPALYVFDTCSHFIRTVPSLPRSQKDPDDIDTDAEDHIYDAVGYKLITPTGEASVSYW